MLQPHQDESLVQDASRAACAQSGDQRRGASFPQAVHERQIRPKEKRRASQHALWERLPTVSAEKSAREYRASTHVAHVRVFELGLLQANAVVSCYEEGAAANLHQGTEGLRKHRGHILHRQTLDELHEARRYGWRRDGEREGGERALRHRKTVPHDKTSLAGEAPASRKQLRGGGAPTSRENQRRNASTARDK